MKNMIVIIYIFLAGCSLIKRNDSCSIVEKNPQSKVDYIPDPDQFIMADQEPIPLNIHEFFQKIGYPVILREAGIYGKVVFRILVDEKGNYVQHEVLKSPHPLLTIEFEKYLPELRFTPAMKDGVPVKFWINIPFYIHPID